MQVLSFAFTRGITRTVLLATGSLALGSISSPVSGQAPLPEKKPAVQKPAVQSPAVQKPAVQNPVVQPAAVKPAPKKKAVRIVGSDDNGETPIPTLTPVSAGPNEVTHLVKKDDTLWDLAKAYLKDPFRWPDVFDRNSDIVENPHWIYPGETIRIPASEVRPEVLARIVTKPVPPPDRTVFSVQQMGMMPDRIGSNGEVLGRMSMSGVSFGEIEAAPFTDRIGGPRGAGRLSGAYDRPGIEMPAGDRRFQLKDRIFVELPASSSARVGDVLVSYYMGAVVSDDAQLVIPTGILRIIATAPGMPAIARVMKQFAEIRLDQEVMALNDLKPSVGTPARVAAGPAEKVIYIANESVLPSLQNYVILSARATNGVRVGDQFTLIDDSVDPRYPAPAVAAAIAEVVRVTPYGVTAIIVDHEQPKIHAGMLARLSARAP